MSPRPVTADLSTDVLVIQSRWKSSFRPEQENVYATEFAPIFAPLFARLPLHGQPADMGRPTVLVSVLGLSWQPVALMAAWVRPERMLVIGTHKSLAARPAGEPVLSLVARIARIPLEIIEWHEAPDEGELCIYREVRAFMRRHGFEGERARFVAIDPTGGKKSMSVSAGLAGFVTGARLVYVDYTQYEHGIPVAGTEYPRLLANPLEEFGDIEIDRIRGAFNRGDFLEAEHLADALAMRLYEPREAEALRVLSAGYGAWAQFQFSLAAQHLGQAAAIIDRHAARGAWRWTGAIGPTLTAHQTILAALAATPAELPDLAAGLPVLLNHVAAATRALDTGRTSICVLMTYASVERYVDACLRVLFGLDDENPDYQRVQGQLDMARYHETGRAFFGKAYEERASSGPLMFGNGIQLLASLRPDLITRADLGMLRGLGARRNKCEFEHGFLPKPLNAGEARQTLDSAFHVLARGFPGVDIENEVARYRFPRL